MFDRWAVVLWPCLTPHLLPNGLCTMTPELTFEDVCQVGCGRWVLSCSSFMTLGLVLRIMYDIGLGLVLRI